MIKGVNKQVVDVSETGSEYFERALFFVNPKYYGITDGKLKEKAQSLMGTAGTPPKSKKLEKKNRLKIALTAAASAAAGSIVTLFTTLVF